VIVDRGINIEDNAAQDLRFRRSTSVDGLGSITVCWGLSGDFVEVNSRVRESRLTPRPASILSKAMIAPATFEMANDSQMPGSPSAPAATHAIGKRMTPSINTEMAAAVSVFPAPRKLHGYHQLSVPPVGGFLQYIPDER